jgi:tRNA(Met) cytidine acetyltransferase
LSLIATKDWTTLRSITQLADFREPLQMARIEGHRLMLVVAMSEEQGITKAQKLTHLSPLCLWVDGLKNRQSTSTDHQYITAAQANQYLGTSNQYVVYNAHSGFNASALCGLSGTILAGGVLILLTPPRSQWHSSFDTQLQNYGQSATNPHSYFIQWWQQQWQHHEAVYMLQGGGNGRNHRSKVDTWQPLPNLTPASKLLEPTAQQQSVVEQLLAAYNQQTSMVFTIDAHRGRGKSSCLGWLIKAIGKDAKYEPAHRAIPDLIKRNIIVTAPSKRALGSMIQTAEPQSINFYALDALLTSLPKAGMLIVDEAAAIPLSQLTKLLTHYSLVVLSSTQDGYEGSGQGYRLKLPRIIKSLGRTSTSMTLTQPMRWQANDPLEEFIRSSFLCDVKTPAIDQNYSCDSKQSLTYIQVTGQHLAHNNALLRQVYALLMLAHYQTTPQDLRILLDHPKHTIHLCYVGDQLAGLAWVANEGGLDSELAQQIALGKRRIQGHLLAQILAQQAGFSSACEMRSWRIQRLVVLPSLQCKGLGSALLQKVYGLAQESLVDFVGASFSASTDTLKFWRANYFLPAWLGIRADAATGLNSVQVIRPISVAATQLTQHLTFHLQGYLAFGRDIWFGSIDAKTWQYLHSEDFLSATEALNTEQQQRLLTLLARGHAGFSGPLYLLYQHLQDEKDKQTVMNAAQNNTHKGLQRVIRHLATCVLESSSRP